MDAPSLLECTTPAGRPGQLFSTRLERFCPGEHCAVVCGPGTCTCRPCGPNCPFCRERRAKRTIARPEVQPTFGNRHFRLINDFTHQPKETK